MASQPRMRLLVRPRIFRPLTRVVRLPHRPKGAPLTIGLGQVVIGFAALIALGTVLLSLPVAREPRQSWDFLTSLFTSASAVCVTGLVVVDTGAHWSNFGEGVILGLIQAGGFGIMTAAMLLLIVFGRPVSLQDRFAMRETAGLRRIRNVTTLILATLALTVVLEALGGLVLYAGLHNDLGETRQTIWKSAFLSISAFNNAGFDNLGSFDSLARFARDPLVLLTIATLAIVGGLGAITIFDIVSKRSLRRLSLQSRLVLITTLALLAFGFLSFLGAEYNHTGGLAGLPVQDKLSNSFFHAATPRTAGFSTVDPGQMHEQTQILNMSLMFVGGATGGTAGGIKVGTLALLLLATATAIRGHESVRAFGRQIGHPLVYRALSVAMLYVLLILFATLIITVTDDFAFRQTLFEVVSALGTVGLTTGITPHLSAAGQGVIIALMFIGRVGPLVIMYLLARRTREPAYRLPESTLGIG